MQVLYELIDLLPSTFTPNCVSRIHKLYLFAKENRGLTNREATELFLGNPEKGKYFYILKNNLKKVLMQYLIASPSWKSSKQKEKFEDAYKMFSVYKLFLLNGKRKTAIEIAKGLLPSLQSLELHSMAYAVADDLYIHHSVMQVSTKQRKTFGEIADQEREHENVYAIVRKHYGNVIAICNTRESYNASTIQLFEQIVEEVYQLLHPKRHNTNRFIYIIIVCRYMAIHDYKNIIKYCEIAITSFPREHTNIKSLCFIFQMHQISALTALGKLKEAKEIARKTLSAIPKGNFNWHIILLKRIVVCLYAKEYQEAYQLYKAHQKQKPSYQIIIEQWNIIKGYLYFLIQVGLVEPYIKERFHIGKFINEMPIYEKDKAGHNINILIIQILIQIKRGQYIKIIDRIDSLKAYSRTYTRREETKRTNLFIKMILQMESARFHKKGTENKTKALREKLAQTPLRVGQNLAVEIIPYEVLWEEILLMLDNKFRATTRKKTVPSTKK